MELIGRNVRVRPIGASDAAELHAWWSDKEFAGKYGGYLPMNRPDFEEFLKHGWWFMIETLSERKVGFISYFQPRRDYINLFEIGYGTKPSERGKGYTTEAVRLLVNHLFESRKEIERIEALTDVDNVPSQRVLEKNGFKREAVMKKRFFTNGEYRDDCLYALLREDWIGSRH